MNLPSRKPFETILFDSFIINGVVGTHQPHSATDEDTVILTEIMARNFQSFHNLPEGKKINIWPSRFRNI